MSQHPVQIGVDFGGTKIEAAALAAPALRRVELRLRWPRQRNVTPFTTHSVRAFDKSTVHDDASAATSTEDYREHHG